MTDHAYRRIIAIIALLLVVPAAAFAQEETGDAPAAAEREAEEPAEEAGEAQEPAVDEQAGGPVAAEAEEAEEEYDEDVASKYAAYLSGDAPEMDEPAPVEVFGAPTLINTQTVYQYGADTLGFLIEHRFGELNTGFSDFFGVYAPASVRLSFYYGIFDWLQAGIGAAKPGHYDLNLKLRILEQMDDGSMPLSVSYYGQVLYNAAEGIDDFNHRLSYFQQLLIARQFGYYFSLQLAPSFTHINIVDEAMGMKNDTFGAAAIAKVRVTPTSSIIVEAGTGQLFYDPVEEMQTKPFFGLGYEVQTTGHAFQLFVSTTNQILGPQYYTFNPYDITEEQFFLGFNITRNWNF